MRTPELNDPKTTPDFNHWEKEHLIVFAKAAYERLREMHYENECLKLELKTLNSLLQDDMK